MGLAPGIWSRWSGDRLSGGCGAGKVGSGPGQGSRGRPAFPGSGRLEGKPGSRRRGQYLACGAPGGSARAARAGGPGRGFQMELHSSKEEREEGAGSGGREANAGGRRGLAPSPPRPKET